MSIPQSPGFTVLDISEPPIEEHLAPLALNDDVVLANLRRIRAERSYGGKSLTWQAISRSVESLTGECWGEAKLRILFGSRGVRKYRWHEIVVLAAVLGTTIFDIVLPDPDGDPDDAREAAEFFGMPFDEFTEIYLGITRRRAIMEDILIDVVSRHPLLRQTKEAFNSAIEQVKQAGGPWGDLFFKVEDVVSEMERAIHEEIDRRFLTTGVRSGKRSKYEMSETLQDMANAEIALMRRPVLEVSVSADDGNDEVVLARDDPNGQLTGRAVIDDDKVNKILNELGVLDFEMET